MTGRRVLGIAIVLALAAGFGTVVPERRAVALAGSTVAVIGDYGVNTTAEGSVATLVAGWNPAAVVTVGDNYYTSSATGDYDKVVGKYYCAFLKGAGSGTNCAGGTADVNRFFPATGNHDYSDGGISNYTSYFALPGTELVYGQVVGDVEFFFIDSQACLNSGSELSAERTWLQNGIAASTVAWQVVVLHHPPYSSSSSHGSTGAMQWDFVGMGADLVLAGHDHTYERLSVGGLTYVVNGLGGAGRYSFGTAVTGSQYRYNANWGAMKLVSTATTLTGTFYSIDGTARDTFEVTKGPAAFGKSSPASNAKQVPVAPTLSWAEAVGATDYEYCYDATVNSACDASWVSTSGARTATLSGLARKRSYEWQVRAVNATGTTGANAGRWWKFTTVR